MMKPKVYIETTIPKSAMKATSEIDQIRAVRKDLAAKCHNDLVELAVFIRKREALARQSGRRIIATPDEAIATEPHDSVPAIR
ncbi:MAG: hypothetical protein NTW21_36540 [Verrucomicrobia bacterium]|nr:hypothetical protein [Verrucomicrobiota bacterium]